MSECELEQDDFVVIFKAFYEGYISKSDKYYPPRGSSITQETCSSLAGAKKITQKSRSDLSTLDFLILFDHAKSMDKNYDPEQGIFLTEDPAKPDYKDPLTMNTYAYCKNNPIMNIDPDGEFWWIVGAVVGALWAGSENNWDLGKMFEGAFKGAAIALGAELAVGAVSWAAANISVSAKFGYYLEAGGASAEVLGATWTAGQGLAWTGAAAGSIYWAGDTVAGWMNNASRENMEALRLNAQDNPSESYAQLADAYMLRKGIHWHYFDDSGNQWGIWNATGMPYGDISWNTSQNRNEYEEVMYHWSDEIRARKALDITKSIYREGTRYSIYPDYLNIYPKSFVGGRNCQTSGYTINSVYNNLR